MKLADVDVIVTAPPSPGWGGRYWIFVKVTTACGIVGWGECYASSVGPTAMRAVIEDVFARHVAGEHPANIELMFRRAYSSGFTQRPDLTVMGAFSGLEIACWDILGKALDRPVWALLGGKTNDRLRAYTYLYPKNDQDHDRFWVTPEMSAEAALAWVEEGFTAVKFDPAGPYTIRPGHQPAMRDISRSVAFCKAIREAVGDRADLLFGTHGQFSTGGAIRMAHAIAPYQPLWFEEPIPPDNVAAMARVAAASSVPVATGERLTTKAEFAPILREGAATILQPALGRVGGINEARKIAALAEVYNAQMAPHLYAGPIEWAANVALGTAIPNLLMVETIETGCAFHRALIGDTIRFDAGDLIPPDAPGLGIEVNEALARAHPYTGDQLHLQMQEAPCDYAQENVFAGGAPVRPAENI
ncbi:mandelate racemase/muconate lactonizing enzyme family protein [Actibacterium sp. 188UL27-1]|uniref:mandelate racemase/muconate lactonizing enzyme family protein n=1 Tax=Actibacterium sp. 188UL27-1 TaxID=2786961 RepID=UPI0019592E73|nr:mandelate racemase/muconate lactonizing enzyme family protein [Actibacterium sp. 188UL27-1]MBM7066487.1 mandelate racemase/muconate lactonizing enzyme family protein [Actibacterium sp. 188UL27-1]